MLWRLTVDTDNVEPAFELWESTHMIAEGFRYVAHGE